MAHLTLTFIEGFTNASSTEALIRAEQILDGEKPDGTAILVVGRPIPHVVADHARRLKVRLIADVKVK